MKTTNWLLLGLAGLTSAACGSNDLGNENFGAAGKGADGSQAIGGGGSAGGVGNEGGGNADGSTPNGGAGTSGAGTSNGGAGTSGASPRDAGGNGGNSGSGGAAGSSVDAGRDGAIITGRDASSVGTGTLGGGETTATCAIPALPEFSGLQSNAKMPDPFKSLDGTRISRIDQWSCRRAEIAAQSQKYELGTKPAKPAMVSGSFTSGRLTVNVGNGAQAISFVATITVPTTGSPPYPAMIAIGGSSLPSLASLGVAAITFPNDDVAVQVDGSSRGQGKFYTLYGSNHSAGAMMAWAWGVSRLIDVLEQTPSANIDTKRLGVTGCSRNGKGALVAGAFDERIALTIPQESGSGGAASWRVSDAQKAGGANIQTLGEITGENVWFASSFSQFNSAATRLPYDHHMLEGLVAPRALLVIENNIDWLGPVSTTNNSLAGHTIWQALGIPDKMGFSLVGNHAHCSFPAGQTPEVQAFVTKYLVGGGTASTAILKNDQNIAFDQATWVDWTTPALQ
jgi:hypothetical protein